MSDNINISVIPKCIDKAIENILDKPSKNIGDTIADIWYLVLGGSVSSLAGKRKLKYYYDLEKFRKRLDEKINEIPEEKRAEPSIQIIGQFLQASQYCVESDILREMFSSLIASSLNQRKKCMVHPLFGDILRKMTPLDAKIIYIYSKESPMDFLPKANADDLAFSIVAILELGIIEEVENQDLRNYKFNSFSALYYAITQEYTEYIEKNDKALDIVSIKEYEFQDFVFLQDFLRARFKLTRLGQSLVNVCIE